MAFLVSYALYTMYRGVPMLSCVHCATILTLKRGGYYSVDLWSYRYTDIRKYEMFNGFVIEDGASYT